jgi:lipase maturation factor 1
LQKCLPARWCRNADERPVRQWSTLEICRSVILVPVVAIMMLTSFVQFYDMFHTNVRLPIRLSRAYEDVEPLRTFNGYGLFQVMTTSRPEIIVQGSRDGVTWRNYEFKYKAGDLKRRPTFVEPHQPRLDWQMWFAALGNYQSNPWFVQFCVRLLEGSPPVLELLEKNPFPDAPPKYIRAVVFEYHFTDAATKKKTGEWWRRELVGGYLPIISLRTGPGGQSGLPTAP